MKKENTTVVLILVLLSMVSVQAQNSDRRILASTAFSADRTNEDTVVLAVLDQETSEIGKSIFSIYGGLAFPMGDFADKNNGGAKRGLTAGLQYVTRGKIGGILNLSYTANPCDPSESLSLFGGQGTYGYWHSLGAFLGLKIGIVNSTSVDFYAAPLLGMNISSTPQIKYVVEHPGDEPTTVKMHTTQNSVLTYGLMSEIYYGHIILGIRYIAYKPKFIVETEIETGSGPNPPFYSFMTNIEQSTSVLLLYAGLGF
jgi:hypothetical protein